MAGPFNLTPAALISDLVTASDLLNIASNVDIVAVLDQESMQQIFADARPLKATVKETARVMDYPVETGAILSDHRVSNPTEIEMLFIINSAFYASAYQAIRNAWLMATKLSVQTKTGTYKNMIIADMPHEEDPDMFDAINQFIRFREVILVAPSSVASPDPLANYAPADPVNQSTVNRGLISAITTGTSGLSYFHAASVWGI